ncbi:replication initiator protein A, partial [Clostridium botulinum]
MENNEKINSKNKIISENTTVIDNNIIESPLFISSLKEVVEVEQLEKYIDKNRSIHRVIEVIKEDYEGTSNPKNYKNVPVVYRQWTDSKGLERQLLVTHAIPDMYTMDVWNALIGLYIQKISPIHFNNNKNTYDLDVNEMEFTLYELAKFMNKSTGGSTLDKLMKEIVRLNNAKYYSFANGVIFDKKKEKYLKSKTKGMSLILDCEFDSEKRVKDEKVNSKCKVEFNKLIIDNIRYQYIKYIDPKEYFALPSRGLTRRLYVYLKGNSHQSNGTKYTYIKRSFYVLKNKIPILEKQPSKIKERLKVPLKNLIKNGMITDYFYGDEDVINEQEPCIYFIFKGQKDEVINSLRKKYEEKQLQLEVAADNIKKDEFQMKIPENL